VALKTHSSVSVLILTKNEERDLPGCLASVSWCDDVHVFDSGSTDGTVEVATTFGATVTSRTYPEGTKIFGGDEAAHRNWGLANIPFKHPWLLVLDADERMSVELVAAVRAAAEVPAGHVAFRVQRRDFFMGTWLKHVQASPFYMRLFRPEKMRYERLVNPVSLADGPVGQVAGYLDHFPFSKGIVHWIERHNAYSTLEARQIQANRAGQKPFSVLKAFTAKDFNERRFHQKEVFYRVPLRPLLKFLLLYIGRGGFLDGRAGLAYATLQSIYEYFIVLKTHELQAETARARA